MATEKERTAQLRRMKRRPSTPGEVMADLLDEMGVTQSNLSEALGVPRATISRLIRGQQAMTPDMAQRLARYFGGGPGLWLRMQATVDMWDLLHMDTTPYKNIKPVAAPTGA